MKKRRKKMAKVEVSKGRLPFNKRTAIGVRKSEGQQFGKSAAKGSAGDKEMDSYAARRNRQIRAQKRGDY